MNLFQAYLCLAATTAGLWLVLPVLPGTRRLYQPGGKLEIGSEDNMSFYLFIGMFTTVCCFVILPILFLFLVFIGGKALGRLTAKWTADLRHSTWVKICAMYGVRVPPKITSAKIKETV